MGPGRNHIVCEVVFIIYFMQDLSKTLYDRALAYLNVDWSVTGHDRVNIGASPLLYNVIYTATKTVSV